MNNASITIHRLMPADAELYRGIRLEALCHAPEAFGSSFQEENARELSWFADRLDRSHVLGALDGERGLLGMAGLAIEPGEKRAHKGLLWGMYVRPQARGAGIGRRLVEAILDIARQHVELIQLTVTRRNFAARRLYTALGFKEYGLERDALKVGDRYFDEILMVLDLRAD